MCSLSWLSCFKNEMVNEVAMVVFCPILFKTDVGKF